MLIIDNFIHSDLHPGNIMIRFLKPKPPVNPFLAEPASPETGKDATAEVRSRLTPHRGAAAAWAAELDALDAEGYRPQLVFIDAGLVTQLSAPNRRNFLDLFGAIAAFDGLRAGQLMIARSRAPGAVRDGDGFALRIAQIVRAATAQTLALGAVRFGAILGDVLALVRAHHVRMEGDFVNVVLAMMLLEGIGRALDPRLDLLQRYVRSDLAAATVVEVCDAVLSPC